MATPANTHTLRLVVAEFGRPIVHLLPPAHELPDDPSDYDRVILSVEPQLLDRRVVGARDQEACDPYLFNIINAMRCGFRVGQTPPEAYLESLVPEITEHLRTHYPVGRRRRERHGLSDNRLARALTLIEERLAEPLVVEEIAEAVHLSPFHFARMFRRSTGHSPHEYVTSRRVEKAKTMLAVSDVPLAEVARRVGYRTQAHFTRVFHVETGTTPRRYRQANRTDAPRKKETRQRTSPG